MDTNQRPMTEQDQNNIYQIHRMAQAELVWRAGFECPDALCSYALYPRRGSTPRRHALLRQRHWLNFRI